MAWANLFEYMGSDENVRLKFAIDKIGVGLDETSIIFGDSLNGDAWDRFISSLKKGEGRLSRRGKCGFRTGPDSFSLPEKGKISRATRYRWVGLSP